MLFSHKCLFTLYIFRSFFHYWTQGSLALPGGGRGYVQRDYRVYCTLITLSIVWVGKPPDVVWLQLPSPLTFGYASWIKWVFKYKNSWRTESLPLSYNAMFLIFTICNFSLYLLFFINRTTRGVAGNGGRDRNKYSSSEKVGRDFMNTGYY